MKLLTLLACFLGTSLGLLGQKTAATPTGITGEWNGSYGKLRFVFHINKEGEQYVSTMDNKQKYDTVKGTACSGILGPYACSSPFILPSLRVFCKQPSERFIWIQIISVC